MTCFWDGIFKQLDNKDFNIMFNCNKTNRVEFIKLLKKHNKIVNGVKWNNNELLDNEKKEIYTAIKNYDISKINNGHLCSTCDYFLVFISYLCKVDIIHNYNGIQIKYTNNEKRKILKFNSNKKHFW